MNYREKIQDSLNEFNVNYNLKTNEELIGIIIDFGCGETDFHTADIERLIKEHRKLRELLLLLKDSLSDDWKNNPQNVELFNIILFVLENYKN